MSSDMEPGKMKVVELRSELSARGLDTKGNKPVLVERLKKAIEEETGKELPNTSVDNLDKSTDSVNQTPSPSKEPVPSPRTRHQQRQTEVKKTPPQPTTPTSAATPASTPSTPVAAKASTPAPTVAQATTPTSTAVKATVPSSVPAQAAAPTPTPTRAVAPTQAPVRDVAATPAATASTGVIPDADASSQPPPAEVKKEPVQEPAKQPEVKVESEVPAAEVTQVEKPDEVNVAASEGEQPKEEEEEPMETTEETSEEPVHNGADHMEAKVKEEPSELRGEKRARSPSPVQKQRSQSPSIVAAEDEPEFDEEAVILDWYNSDLNLVIDKDNFTAASPLHEQGFGFVWAGARATYGFQKGCVRFEVKVTDHCDVSHLDDEPNPHVLRVGWSVDDSSMQLGEDPQSYGYGGTGKASTNCKFKDYGTPFQAGDTIGAFLNMDTEPITISFTRNGVSQGVAYEVVHSDLEDKALFPHILSKNSKFEVNFGQEKDWFDPLPGYTFAGTVPLQDRVRGTARPSKRSECEMIMMCGLPGSGKTTWANEWCVKNPAKKYNVLGTNNLIDKMKVMGLPRKRNYAGRWDVLIDKCTKCLNHLLEMASKRRRNYILDQTNVYPSAQRRKMRGFEGFIRRAVVIVPTDEEFKRRCDKREKEEGKDVPDSAVLEMKANFQLPQKAEIFEEVMFVELQDTEAKKLVDKYNKEGSEAGYGGPSKRFRPNSSFGGNNRGLPRGGGGGFMRGRGGDMFRGRGPWPPRGGGPPFRGGPGQWRGGGSRGGPPPLMGRAMMPHGGGGRGGRGGGGGSGHLVRGGGGGGPSSSMVRAQGNSGRGWGNQGSWNSQSYGQQSWNTSGYSGQQGGGGSGGWRGYSQQGYGASYNQQGYGQQGYGYGGNWNQQQYYGQGGGSGSGGSGSSGGGSGYYGQQQQQAQSWSGQKISNEEKTAKRRIASSSVTNARGYGYGQQQGGWQSYGQGGYGGYNQQGGYGK